VDVCLPRLASVWCMSKLPLPSPPKPPAHQPTHPMTTPSTSTQQQIALREVATLMLQDDSTLQGLSSAFRKLDPEGSGRVPFERALAELRDGDYDLSKSEVCAGCCCCWG